MLAALAALAALPSLSPGKGAPIPHQVSKDFRNYIIQGERPEIAACMAAAFDALRHDRHFQEIKWLDTTSDTALMHETGAGEHLERRISLDAKAILSGTSFLDVWVKIKVDCEQRDEGYPHVKISVVGSR
jgi:hypothetical protein